MAPPTEENAISFELERQDDLCTQKKLFAFLSTIPRDLNVCLDIETTGLEIGKDEILQISLIDGNGTTLLNEYVNPRRLTEWPDAEKIHGISPEMVHDCKTMDLLAPRISEILMKAELIIGYNCEAFDIPFLKAQGVYFPFHASICDMMHQFAIFYGEWLSCKQEYRWKSLSFCSSSFGYRPGDEDAAHNSLSDAKATLFCFHELIKASAERGQPERKEVDSHG